MFTQVKVSAVEIGFDLEDLPCGKRYPASVLSDQTVVDLTPQGPVDVNGGQSERVAQLFLRHRQLIGLTRRNPLHIQSGGKLAEQMRYTGTCIAPADVHHPFAVDRCIDHGAGDQGIADGSPVTCQSAQRGLWNRSDLAACQGLDTVISNLEIELLQIDDLTGDQDRDNLSMAFARNLVTKGKS
jgi:hypothetical protein